MKTTHPNHLPLSALTGKMLSPDVICAIADEESLQAFNAAYHEGSPAVSDAEYDALWRKHTARRIKLGDEFVLPTILDEVGAAPQKSSGFRKVKHLRKMLSINDVFEGEGAEQYTELRTFVGEMERKLGNDAWPMVVEPKVDGLAVKLIYSNGLLTQGLTRGSGEEGDDITDNLRISGIVPQSIIPDEAWNGTQANPLNAAHLEIVGEVYMPLDAFAAANLEREKEGLQLWANPRNAAAGALKLQDAEELKRRPLAFVRHDGYTPWIEGMQGVQPITAYHWKQLVEAIETIRNEAHPYATDGAVVKLDNLQARETVGMGTRAPNWACAFKFRPVQVETTLEEIIVQVGRTGALTPVARMKPALVDGSTVEFATLNNEDHINRLGLRVGDTVILQKQGAIIPAISESVSHRKELEGLTAYMLEKYGPNGITGTKVTDQLATFRKPFNLSKHLDHKCPSCGERSLVKKEVAGEDGVKWYCANSQACPAQLARRIEHFCSRGCLDIEGIGAEMSVAIAQAFHHMDIEHPIDLLDWTAEDLMVMSWTTASGGTMTFGESRAKKAVEALERAKKLPLHRWLRALGIHTIGENTSKEISRLCADMPSVRGECGPDGLIRKLAQDDDLAKDLRLEYHVSPRLGLVSARALVDWVYENMNTVNSICAVGFKGVRSDNYDPIPVASDSKPLFGQTFVLTGTLSEPRPVLQALIESKGGKCSGSVSAKTTYLVVGEGGGGKADKAKKLGVKTLTEAELRKLL